MGSIENTKAEAVALSDAIREAVADGKWTRAKELTQQLIARIFVLEDSAAKKP